MTAGCSRRRAYAKALEAPPAFVRPLLAAAIISLTACFSFAAATTKTFVAYSMKVAQERVRAAAKAGEDFRKKQPDLFYLGGITKPWAVVLDRKLNDWVLLGERERKGQVLTLDDWAVALRARSMYADQDPGVSIDPRPCTRCIEQGRRGGCHHQDTQQVRYFGGVEDTHFGQVCFEADWLMKRIGLGLEEVPVEGLEIYFDLCEQLARESSGLARVASRFWFYPTASRVNAIGDVVLLERLQMGVFTELLYAEIDGRPVQNLDAFEHRPAEIFSRSFSRNYDTLAEARDAVGALRGLTRLAALAKGLHMSDRRPPLAFWLEVYTVEHVPVPKSARVLSRKSATTGFEVLGGVSLAALVMRVKEGRADALRDLVLAARRSSDALSWEFSLVIDQGRIAAARVPAGTASDAEAAALFAHAVFLGKRKRYDAAIEAYSRALELAPCAVGAYVNRGGMWNAKGDHDRAIADAEKALSIFPGDAGAYVIRGRAHDAKGAHHLASADFTKAISLDPAFVTAYVDRAASHAKRGEHGLAIADCERALVLSPNCPEALNNLALSYAAAGRSLVRAISFLERANAISPDPQRLVNLGELHRLYAKHPGWAVEHYKEALSLSPSYPPALSCLWAAYVELGNHGRAVSYGRKYLEAAPQGRHAQAVRQYLLRFSNKQAERR